MSDAAVAPAVGTGRRGFLLRVSAGAGFMLAWQWPALAAAEGVPAAAAPAAPFAPNAFVRIASDSTVTVIVKHVEMGQGAHTGLATLVAEELDADWSQMRVQAAPADAKLYNNLAWGPVQGTGQSTSIANSFAQLRKAGATARAMLVAAAAAEWGVPVEQVSVDGGVLSAGRHRARFGELAARAATLPVPAKVALKSPEQFRCIGRKERLARFASRERIDGSLRYTLDLQAAQVPGLLTALVAHPPLFGAVPASFDAGRAKAMDGVVDVVQVPSGVAVLARNFWAAKQGRDALQVEWDSSKAHRLGSAAILAQYRELAKGPGLVARNEGEIEAALQGAARRIEASFDFPYLAHAPMEPLDCVLRMADGACEVWSGNHFQTIDQFQIAAVLGLPNDKVKLHMLAAGGSFGRRSNPRSDYMIEAAQVLKASGARAPVKLVWTREDDLRGGYYRPIAHHRLEAGLDAQGALVAWRHRVVVQSIVAGTPLEGLSMKNGIDPMSVDGAANLPYDVPNLQVDLHSPKLGVPVLWWRSVGHSHNAFSTEAFIDELAQAAGRDPLEFRLALLRHKPRHKRVLELAAERAGWGRPLRPGRGRGLALHESFNTYVAQVAEVRVAADGTVKVDRVVCAIDCGLAVNPDIVMAQMEGGIAYGLSAALHGAITLDDEGRVEQSNFDGYRVLRIDEMPKVEVHVVASDFSPSGVGEPGVPPIAPAVANAVFAASGRRIRSLPVQ